ncbi:hypothetical protein [Promicromonospora sp. MEB111]|uniref:hypothetical protein n=1 Tax=unclassified Promicromonospora TaxID=2647929 RepID=UPI00254BA4CF|nr:hypothetical protein [Promicromonospora sp. MEB111]
MTTTGTGSTLRTTATTSAGTGSAAGTARDVGHEHAWTTDSRHRTSAGYVLYVRCTACGAHRVDLQRRTDAPPAPLSRAAGGASRAPTPA